jgi:hypothetical protein
MKTPSSTRLRTFFSFLAIVLWASSATAEQSSGSSTKDDSWAPVKHLEFSPDDVEGGYSGPEGEQITSVPRTLHPSLIEIRQGFEAEIVKTMENL